MKLSKPYVYHIYSNMDLNLADAENSNTKVVSETVILIFIIDLIAYFIITLLEIHACSNPRLFFQALFQHNVST